MCDVTRRVQPAGVFGEYSRFAYRVYLRRVRACATCARCHSIGISESILTHPLTISTGKNAERRKQYCSSKDSRYLFLSWVMMCLKTGNNGLMASTRLSDTNISKGRRSDEGRAGKRGGRTRKEDEEADAGGKRVAYRNNTERQVSCIIFAKPVRPLRSS